MILPISCLFAVSLKKVFGFFVSFFLGVFDFFCFSDCIKKDSEKILLLLFFLQKIKTLAAQYYFFFCGKKNTSFSTDST